MMSPCSVKLRGRTCGICLKKREKKKKEKKKAKEKLLSPEAAGLFCSNLHAALTHKSVDLDAIPGCSRLGDHDDGTNNGTGSTELIHKLELSPAMHVHTLYRAQLYVECRSYHTE